MEEISSNFSDKEDDLGSHDSYSADEADYNFFLKNKRLINSIRINYLSKLVVNKLIKKCNNHKHNTILIFDWDVLCASVLSLNGSFEKDTEISTLISEKIKDFENIFKNLLLKAIENGDTYIFTNSELGDIKYFYQRFFPNIYELLDRIRIIRAKILNEEKYLNKILKNYSLKLVTNMIIIGGSSESIMAGKKLISKFQEGFLKIIKFKEYTLISEITRQLVLAFEKFYTFFSSIDNYTINIEEL